MTYYKYSHFLMQEDGPEYERPLRQGPQLRVPASTTAKLVAPASRLIAHVCCRHKSITLTRQRKVPSGGAWR
jgi:hypothetical protein